MTVPLLDIQYAFLVCMAQFQALITGLGYGKTWIGARKAVSMALKFPNRLGLAASNTYRQLEDVVIPEIESALEQMGVKYRWIAGKKMFLLENGAKILCRSLDKTAADTLRGTDFAWAWLDEARDMSKKAFEVVQGRVGRRMGSSTIVFITTTPNGFNWIYTLFGPNRKNKNDYVLFHAKSSDNVTLNPNYVPTLEDAYDERTKKQELDGEFVAAGEVLYHAWDRRLHVSKKAIYNPADPICVALDFNVNPCVGAIIQERAGKTLIVDEIWNDEGTGTIGVVEEFVRRYPAPAGVTIYGDPAGHNRDTRSGTTDYEMWRMNVRGRILVPHSPYAIVDRINSVNSRLKVKRKVSMLVNPKCKHVQEDFDQVLPHKDGSRKPRKSADTHHLTHISDAIGYYVVHEHNVRAKLDRLKHAASDSRGFRR